MLYFCRCIGAFALLLLFAPGCASGEAFDDPGCSGDYQCPEGSYCDLTASTCRPLPVFNNSTNNNQPGNNQQNNTPVNNDPTNNDPTNNDTNNSTNNDPTNNQQNNDPMNNQNPVGCDPECPGHQACVEGSCVDACNPACEAPLTCTEMGCRLPPCQDLGDSCYTSQREQGNFACAGNMEVGTCVERCDSVGSASTCGMSEYCFRVGPDTEVGGCGASECENHGDCGTNTCILLDNDFGLCVSAGGLAVGQPCNTNQNGCIQGAFCMRVDEGMTGICSLTCDPWAANPGCAGNHRCGRPFSEKMGLCYGPIDTLGSNPYDDCANPGNPCAQHASMCVDFDDFNACMRFCREGENDCASILSPQSICTRRITGHPSVGACVPSCPQTPCGDGFVCHEQLCYLTCPTNNVVTECCDGMQPCDAMCISGRCEFPLP